jgi:cell division protein FtsB
MKKALKVLTNKYLLTAVAFLAWAIYFDQNDYFSLQQRQKELNGIKENIAYLNGEINRMNTEKNELLTNPSRQEQYARENYRMKRDGEDVYVIDDVAEKPEASR